jgi:hypothetical protein
MTISRGLEGRGLKGFGFSWLIRKSSFFGGKGVCHTEIIHADSKPDEFP